MSDNIDSLLEEILVDADGDSEQLTSFELAFQESVRFPFAAQVVGSRVDVVRVEFDGDERHGLTAVCKRDAARYQVSLQDVVPGPVAIETARLLAAYRKWLGLGPLESSSTSITAEAWTYLLVASKPYRLERPLVLNSMGTWDPDTQYWGEPDQEIHPLHQAIIAAGPRPKFEMEQVIPGDDPDDWDSDPIIDAADSCAKRVLNREATQRLRRVLELDERCIDAWVHLGNMAFESKGPKAALEFYDVAVGIGEQSLPEDFAGVLPRGSVDNRPFHRALHGLGLCAWRQRRWIEAETIFTNLLWIDGAQTWTALECLLAVKGRRRWRD